MSKVSKPRLGRGLSSLISVSDGPDELVSAPSMLEGDPLDRPPATVVSELPITQRIIQIPVGEVKSNPHQPRRDFQESSLQELAASLKTNGLIQPIVVRQSGVGYELIAGE